jgi:hypothetical protein
LKSIRGAIPWRIEAPAARAGTFDFSCLNFCIKVQDQLSGMQHAKRQESSQQLFRSAIDGSEVRHGYEVFFRAQSSRLDRGQPQPRSYLSTGENWATV